MKKHTKITILSVILAFLMLLPTALPTFAVSYDDIKDQTSEELRAEVERLQAEINELQQKIDQASADREAIFEQKVVYDEISNLYTSQLNILEIKIEKLNFDYIENEKQLFKLQEEYDRSYSDFLELMRLSYVVGNASYLEILIGAESISDFFSRLAYVSSMIGYSDRLLDRLERASNELEETGLKLQAVIAEQKLAAEEIEKKQAELDSWDSEHTYILKELEDTINSLGGEYAVLGGAFEQAVKEMDAYVQKLIEEEEQRIKEEEERKRLEEEAERIANMPFLWPVDKKFSYISCYYGYRDIPELGLYNDFHHGIDIPATKNSNIYAVKDGTCILSVTGHRTYGNYVMLSHADGTVTLYAHCNENLINVGDYVKQGDVIGLIGTTGLSTGNHLHFEIRIDGVKKNPMNYLKRP